MLHRRYPASALGRASPPPATARPVPRGLPVGIAPTVMGFPCYRSIPAQTCHHHYPGELARCFLRSLPAPCQPSPNLNRVGVRLTLFEACSVFTRVTACLLADSLHEPLSSGASTIAVTSDVRPNCFRRSESCRVGFLFPTEVLRFPRRTEISGLELSNHKKTRSHKLPHDPADFSPSPPPTAEVR